MPQLLRCPQPASTDHAQLYELLVSELTDFAVFLTDPTGCIVSWNPGVERLLGYPEAEWLGQPAHLIFTPEDRAARVPEQEMSTATHDGRAADIRWHQRQDGSRLYVEGTLVALQDGTGQLLGFSKVMRDITERKRTEEQLRAALAYAESIIATVRTPMLVLDGALRIRSANRSFYRAFQVSPTETDDRLLYELGNRQWDIPRLRTLLEEVLPQNATVEDFEVEHVFPALGKRVMLLNARTLWREGNHTELVLLALEDITERKQAEAALARQAEQLARSNADLQQFAYITSHDLQEPLRAMSTFSQLLLQRYGGQLDADATECLGYIATGAERMRSLVNSLLAYSQVVSGETLPLTPVPLEAALQGAALNLQTMLAESQASVTHDPLPTVQADPVQLVQLFQNLLNNAVKYRRATEPPQVHVSALRQEQGWRISVRDNGIGVRPEHAERIFGVFKRLHGPEIPGTGIGLAICKRIVERQGGRMGVESEPGGGSTFFFTLPG